MLKAMPGSRRTGSKNEVMGFVRRVHEHLADPPFADLIHQQRGDGDGDPQAHWP
jgi:hypothetical protein